MMTVLLQEELPREHVWEQLLWLVHQYQDVQDTCMVTKVRCCAGLSVDVGPMKCHEGSVGCREEAGSPWRKKE